MMLLALPGSMYVYQGEELGLPEVPVLDPSLLDDPMFLRSGGVVKGRDGCRVPLPWAPTGSSFGFGADGAHLPQPQWFAAHSVQAQDGDPHSTLTLYRRALALRRELQTDEELTWVETGRPDVLWFTRPNGWAVVTNFGSEPFELDSADLVLASADAPLGVVPGETTVWLDAR